MSGVVEEGDVEGDVEGDFEGDFEGPVTLTGGPPGCMAFGLAWSGFSTTTNCVTWMSSVGSHSANRVLDPYNLPGTRQKHTHTTTHRHRNN